MPKKHLQFNFPNSYRHKKERRKTTCTGILLALAAAGVLDKGTGTGLESLRDPVGLAAVLAPLEGLEATILDGILEAPPPDATG